jgi:hypothetical protein
MRIFKILLASVVAVSLFSCEPTFKKEYSWAYPIAGDWMITAYDSTSGSAVSNPFEMRAYNPSFGTDSVWIDDYATTKSNGKFWSMKFKVAANMSAKTFSAITSTNQLPSYHINIIVRDGKIVGTDSLYMRVVFGDDPTSTYILTGHRETGYDEYMGIY